MRRVRSLLMVLLLGVVLAKELAMQGAHSVLGLRVWHDQRDVGLGGALGHHLHCHTLTPQNLEHLQQGKASKLGSVSS